MSFFARCLKLPCADSFGVPVRFPIRFSHSLPLFMSIFLPLFLLGACGAPNTESRLVRPDEASIYSWKGQSKAERFTQEQIDAVLSSATKVVNGRVFPESKEPLKFLYNAANVPGPFKTEFGELTAGAEIRGYLNLGAPPSEIYQSRFLSNLEKISTWKNIKDTQGSPVFTDAFTTDVGGQRIEDWSDGQVSGEGEVHSASLSLDTNTPIGSLRVPSTVTMYNRGGEIQFDVTNYQEVRVPFLGTIINTGGLNIHVKAYPHGNGWLIYGASVVKLQKLENFMKPEDLVRYIDAMFSWIKEGTILPLD
jgi:hypothetical protein